MRVSQLGVSGHGSGGSEPSRAHHFGPAEPAGGSEPRM